MAENEQPKSRLWADNLIPIIREMGLTQAGASISIGAKSSTLAQYCSGRFDRPSSEILYGIVHNWPADRHTPLVIAHLQDELVRSGLDPQRFTIARHANRISSASNMEAISRAAEASPGWFDLVAALGALAKNDAKHDYKMGSSMAAEMAKVAEPDSHPPAAAQKPSAPYIQEKTKRKR